MNQLQFLKMEDDRTKITLSRRPFTPTHKTMELFPSISFLSDQKVSTMQTVEESASDASPMMISQLIRANKSQQFNSELAKFSVHPGRKFSTDNIRYVEDKKRIQSGRVGDTSKTKIINKMKTEYTSPERKLDEINKFSLKQSLDNYSQLYTKHLSISNKRVLRPYLDNELNLAQMYRYKMVNQHLKQKNNLTVLPSKNQNLFDYQLRNKCQNHVKLLTFSQPKHLASKYLEYKKLKNLNIAKIMI